MIVRLRDTTLRGETIVLSADVGANAPNALGPHLRLEDCELINDCSSKWLSLIGATIVRSQIKTKRSFENLQFFTVAFEACKFSGRFFGCEFGYRGASQTYGTIGDVKDCDFTQARLQDRTFSNCKIDRAQMPTCYTIPNPRDRAHDLSRPGWPGRLRIGFKVDAESRRASWPHATTRLSWRSDLGSHRTTCERH